MELTNLQTPTENKYSDKTASYFAGVPYGLQLVKTMDRAQAASLSGHYRLEFKILRKYYSYTSKFIKQTEQDKLVPMIDEIDNLIRQYTLQQLQPSVKLSMEFNIEKKLHEFETLLYNVTSDLLNKSSSDDDFDIDKEFEDI